MKAVRTVKPGSDVQVLYFFRTDLECYNFCVDRCNPKNPLRLTLIPKEISDSKKVGVMW